MAEGNSAGQVGEEAATDQGAPFGGRDATARAKGREIVCGEEGAGREITTRCKAAAGDVGDIFFDSGGYFGAGPEGGLDGTRAANEGGKLRGFHGGGMVGSGQGAVGGEVFLDDAGPECDGSQGDLIAEGVIGEARRNLERLAKRLHRAKVHALGRCWVLGDAVEENGVVDTGKFEFAKGGGDFIE